MYRSYYSLSAEPFRIDTDPRFLWLGGDHKEALATLKYGLLESNGFVVLTGPVGTGKTTLVNALLHALDHRVIVANINFPSLDPTEFLSLVARTYDPAAHVTGKADCLLFLKAFLSRARTDGKRVLLVIDEAHRLSEALLEEIRLLSNMEHQGETLINIFFVGQTELKRRLLSHHCRALRQRITLFYHLKPLSAQETRKYIAHRLKVSGSDTQPFAPRALDAIHKYARGCPRMINKICDRALLTGYVKEQPVIEAATIAECAREISQIDPIASATAGMHRLAAALRQRIAFTATTMRLRTGLPAAAKWLRAETASSSITLWVAAKRHARKGYGATHNFIQARQRQITMIGTVTAAFLVCAMVAVALLRHQEGPPPPQAIENPPQILDEAYLPASYPPSGAPPAVSSDPATAPAAASMTNASFMEEKANTLLTQGDYPAAIQLLENASPVDGPLATLYARALVGRAAQLKDQSPGEAGKLLAKAVQAAPQNLEALTALGDYYTLSKAYSQAIDVYQKVIEKDPRKTDVLFNLGFIFASTGMYTSSELMLNRVVQLKPDYIDKALFNLAVVQQKLGKRRESMASLEAAMAIRPDNQQARAYLEELKAAQQVRP